MLRQNKLNNIIKRGWESNARSNMTFRDGTVYKYQKGKILAEVHHYMGCGDTWFLSCSALGINCMQLEEIDILDAIDKASEIIRIELTQLYKDGKDI